MASHGRRFLLRALLLVAASSGCTTVDAHHPVASTDPVQVSLRVVLSRPKRCVGPHHMDETDLELSPAASLKFVLRKGAENSLEERAITLVTDVGGVTQVAVPPGEYCLLEDWKERKLEGPLHHYVDPLCQEQLWKSCDAVLHLPEAQSADVVVPTSCWGNCYFGPHP